MKQSELKALLDQKYLQYNRPDFVEDDPVQIPHLFTEQADIEISGFLTALIAWGRRDLIIRSAKRLIEAMDMAPHQFLMQAEKQDWHRLEGFVHRTFNGIDCLALLQALREAYQAHESLEELFLAGIKTNDTDVGGAIVAARTQLTSGPDFPARTHKHLANPARGSSAKRINMFLRWMVRQDNAGVDFGLWKRIDPALLIVPLDVHTGTIARKLGLLDRKQNDWKAALALTEKLREMCPEDPVRYDFSLFGLGVYKELAD
ncbi:MAG: TIGR02757 family protein [Bacteroidota bacterium]